MELTPEPLLHALLGIAVLWTISRLGLLALDLTRGYSYVDGVIAPVQWPLLGNVVETKSSVDTLYHKFLQLALKFGEQTFVMVMPFSKRHYFTVSPANLEWSLKTNFAGYIKGADFHEHIADLLGNGIFAVDGDMWKEQRKIASYIFNVKNFRDYFLEVFKNEGKVLGEILEQAAATGMVVDLHELFHMFTMDSFCRIGFGLELGSLKAFHATGDDTPVPFVQAFETAQKIIDARFWNPWWRWTEHLDGKRKKMDECKRTMDEFAFRVIQDRHADPESAECGDLLSRFMNYKRDGQPEGFTDCELRDIVLNMIIAGRDTTAQALSWTYFNFMQRPQTLKAMRDELSNVMQTSGVTDVSDLSYEQLKQMKYTRACVSEALRLHPSVPKHAKVAVKDDVLPDGTFIPKGSWLSTSSWVLGRLESLWGSDAGEYRPERWMTEPNPSQFKFLAFNAGPRVCLGMQMAYLEATLVIALLSAEFDIQLAGSSSDVVYANALTLPMRNGMPVRVSKRY